MLSHWLKHTGTVQRSTRTGNTYSTPADIDPGLRHSDIVPTSVNDRQRVGIAADVVNVYKVFTTASADNGIRPKREDRFVPEDGTSYRIIHVLGWPITGPQYLEIFIQSEPV